MAKIVIDANVIISAAYGGKPLQAVIRAFQEHEVYFSEAIIRELKEVIGKLAKRLSREQVLFIEEKIHQIVSMGKVIDILRRVTISRDAKDDHYLSLCREANADFLVTGDKDLLSLSPEQLKKNGIYCSIVNPHSFLERIT